MRFRRFFTTDPTSTPILNAFDFPDASLAYGAISGGYKQHLECLINSIPRFVTSSRLSREIKQPLVINFDSNLVAVSQNGSNGTKVNANLV
jgi:hypothetical protein